MDFGGEAFSVQMKRIVQMLFLMAVIIFAMTNCRIKHNDMRAAVRDSVWLKSEAFQQWCRFTFHQDSGFVSSAQNVFFQEIISKRDTTILYPEYVEMILTDPAYDEQNFSRIDTFARDSSGGKYYRGKVERLSTFPDRKSVV